MKPFLLALLLTLLPLRLALGQAAPGLDAYQAAIERELAGVPHDGEIFVDLLPDGRASVTYYYGDGRSVGRTVALPPRYSDAIELVALLAANLVREQVSLGEAPRPESSPPPPAASPPVEAPPDATPPPDEAAASVPPPPPAAVTSGAASPPSTAAPAVAPRFVLLSASVGWSVGTDRLYGRPVIPRLGVHLVAGVGVGVKGASISAGIDVQRGLVHGLQLTGAAAWADRLRGAQVAGAFAAADAAEGIQSAGAVTLASGLRGAQLAGGVAAARRGRGLQAAGGLAIARTFRGAQLAGGAAFAERVRGAQIAGGLAAARDVDGLQLSVVNIAGRLHGLQLGVINYTEESDGLSLGLINFVRNGMVELDAGVESNGLASVVLRHGTRSLYSTYGASSTSDKAVYGPSVGLGARLARAGRLTLDAEGSVTALFGDQISSDLALLARPRMTAAYSLGALALWASAGANVFVTDAVDPGDALHPTMVREWTSDSVTTRLWPSAGAGLRVALR